MIRSTRLRNPALTPDELARELASYLNTEVDPYDFAWLLPRWSGSLDDKRQVDELSEEEQARFAAWLKDTPRGDYRASSPIYEAMQQDPLGAPSYLYFRDAYPLGAGAWCVHFTERAFSSFERGAVLEMLGLSTHYLKKPSVRCDRNLEDDYGLYERVFGFAFAVDELSHPYSISAARRKYGDAAVLFQTDAGVSAYHQSDDERQVIFPLCSERHVVEVTFESGSGKVWLGLDAREADEGEEEPFDSLAEATEYLDEHGSA